jgi:hypothetical protein
MNCGYGKLEKAPKPNAASVVPNKKTRQRNFLRTTLLNTFNSFMRLSALVFSSRRLSIHPKLWMFGAELAYYV